MKTLLLLIAFLLELVGFYFFATLGFAFNLPTWLQWAGLVVLLIVVITVWSLYMAPRAPHQLSGGWYYAVKFAVYTIAALSLARQQSLLLAVCFVVLVAVDELALAQYKS